MKKVFFVILWLLLAVNAYAVKLYERDYQTAFTNRIKGQAEVELQDKTRVDILTDKYAIEVDYARKWQEAIGQSLYYAVMTGKAPGIVLIIKSNKDFKYLNRLLKVLKSYDLNIKVWIIDKTFEIKIIN